MKVLSIKQPWAYLICSGIKDVENRTWRCPKEYVGKRVLIHASRRSRNGEYGSKIFTTYGLVKPKEYSQIYALNKEQQDFLTYKVGNSDIFRAVREFHEPMLEKAIIGSVEIAGCVLNYPSIWSEKTEEEIDQDTEIINIKVQKPVWNWVFKNPILFDHPVLNVKGKLRFWNSNFEEIICPECNHIQLAKVKDMDPWNIFIHKCSNCGYIITESDWEEVK
jgi:ribosomal protein S27E